LGRTEISGRVSDWIETRNPAERPALLQ
jgi:hypothetical protein